MIITGNFSGLVPVNNYFGANAELWEKLMVRLYQLSQKPSAQDEKLEGFDDVKILWQSHDRLLKPLYYELHRAEYDVHVIVSEGGGESIFCSDPTFLMADTSYDRKKDVELYKVPPKLRRQSSSVIAMTSFQYLIIPCGVAHRPLMPNGKHTFVKKYVAKVPKKYCE